MVPPPPLCRLSEELLTCPFCLWFSCFYSNQVSLYFFLASLLSFMLILCCLALKKCVRLFFYICKHVAASFTVKLFDYAKKDLSFYLGYVIAHRVQCLEGIGGKSEEGSSCILHSFACVFLDYLVSNLYCFNNWQACWIVILILTINWTCIWT